jgi:hypothetical protein
MIDRLVYNKQKVLFVFTALDDNYTLCLLDPKQPGKADCGDGYIKR